MEQKILFNVCSICFADMKSKEISVLLGDITFQVARGLIVHIEKGDDHVCYCSHNLLAPVCCLVWRKLARREHQFG